VAHVGEEGALGTIGNLSIRFCFRQ